MKTSSIITLIFSIILPLTLSPSPADAFSSATHIYIADQALPNTSASNKLYYGSIAPDLALYVLSPEKWPTSFEDTHYDYIDLRTYARGTKQKTFALGWLTHNEEWGADYYAHISYQPGSSGYVTEKAQILSTMTGLAPEFAHYAIEVAIDLLVKRNQDPEVGQKLLRAAMLRSPQDRLLLYTVLVNEEKRTDWTALTVSELSFRSLTSRYAASLAMPFPRDLKSLASLGSQLASEIYGIQLSSEELLNLLRISMILCESDYKPVIDYAIEQIGSHFH